jgi:membrane protease YdiL (CAAX protease family)
MEQPKPYPSIVQGFLVIIVALGISAAFTFLCMAAFKGLNPEDKLMKSLLGMIVYIGGMGVTLLLTMKLRMFSGIADKLSFGLASPILILPGVIAVLCIGYMLELFMYLVPISPDFAEMFKLSVEPNIYTFITAVIAAPIIEEIMMRGIILDGFLRRYSPAKSIIWSAVIFGVFHLNPWQAVAGIASGLLLGWLYWKTRSILLCIILHMANNITSYIQTSFSGDVKDTIVTTMGLQYYLIGFVIVFLVFIGCMRYMNRILKKTQTIAPDTGELPV